MRKNRLEVPYIITPQVVAPQEKPHKPTERGEGYIGGALLPLIQSIITGLSTGLLVGFLAYYFGSLDAIAWGAGVGTVLFCVTWIIMLFRWAKLTWLERITGIDLNGDGYTGDEPVAPVEQHTIRINITDANSSKIIDLPCTHEQLITFARGIMAGRTLTEARWSKTFGGRDNFVVFREELVRRGLAQWRSENANQRGLVLTELGQKVFAQLATPLPQA